MELQLPYHCHTCGRNWPANRFRAGQKTCIDCHNAYGREYDAQPENRERKTRYQRERYAQPDYRTWALAQQREYHTRPENRERNRERYAQPDYRERQREYQRGLRSDPEYKEMMRVHAQRYKARKRGFPDTLTTEQWQYALDSFDGCCAVCGRQLNDMFGEFTAAADHWIPISYEGDDNPGTVATNIVPLCHGLGGCNNSKHASMPDEWLTRQYSKRKARKIAQRIQSYFDSLGDE